MCKQFFNIIIICALLVGIGRAQWVQTNAPTYATSMAICETNIFAALGYPYGIYRTTNNGQNWQPAGLDSNFVICLAVVDQKIFAGGQGVYASTNNGQTWVQTGLNNFYVSSLAVIGSSIFAGAYGYDSNYIYLSTNNGINWMRMGSWRKGLINSFVTNGSNIFAGMGICHPGLWGSIYRSTNNGQNWILTANNFGALSLCTSGSMLFAAAGSCHIDYYGFVHSSTDNGETWIQSLFDSTGYISELASIGSNIFAGGSNGVYLSTNNGQSWRLINEGLPIFFVNSFLLTSDYIFVGANNSIWRRPLSQLVGISQPNTEIPEQFKLHQNYPNPFNPTTNIKFLISISGFIKLKIFDVLGREVTTLVNEELKPGSYEVNWDASNSPSGVYFYKLVSDYFSETKKMILVK